jgi:hypothetical protein
MSADSLSNKRPHKHRHQRAYEQAEAINVGRGCAAPQPSPIKVRTRVSPALVEAHRIGMLATLARPSSRPALPGQAYLCLTQ